MPIPRKSMQFLVPERTKEAFDRLCREHERSQSKLFEIFVRYAELGWLRHLTPEEQRRQYFSDDDAKRGAPRPAAASDDANASA
jgi:hypothetical protein